MTTRTASAPAEAELSPVELAAWRGLLRVHAALIKGLDEELESRHGLPVSSYEVLLHLSVVPGRRMRMRDLAEAVLLSRSGLTRLVDRLAADGLIERAACPSDARGSFAVLTDRGQAALSEARPTHLDGVRRRFLSRFDDDELGRLAAYWERVLPGATA
jgi:DNA-binding MarR family transcriptional regulator